MDKRIIGGVFTTVGNAERAITELQRHGYGSNDISVFARDKNKVNVLEEEMDTSVTTNKGGRGKNAGKGAGVGAISGGALGGIGGLVAGLGLLAIPGIGQIAAAGPIAAALTGAGVGAGGGGIVGALVGAGMSEHEAKQYETHLKDGKIIVIVEATEKLQDKVYRTFLNHNTENTSMYPDHYKSSEHMNDQRHATNHRETEKKDALHEEEYAGSTVSNGYRTNETRSRSAERHRSNHTPHKR